MTFLPCWSHECQKTHATNSIYSDFQNQSFLDVFSGFPCRRRVFLPRVWTSHWFTDAEKHPNPTTSQNISSLSWIFKDDTRCSVWIANLQHPRMERRGKFILDFGSAEEQQRQIPLWWSDEWTTRNTWMKQETADILIWFSQFHGIFIQRLFI